MDARRSFSATAFWHSRSGEGQFSPASIAPTLSVLVRHAPIQLLGAGPCSGKKFFLTSQDDHDIFNLIILIKMIKLNCKMRLLKCVIMTIGVFGRSS